MSPTTRGAAILVLLTAICSASKTAQQVQAEMGMGINMGNTLDAPTEGSWAPAAQERFFDAFKNASFQTVRVPVQWGHHTQMNAPYRINSTFMERVKTVAGWSLARGMFTIVNVHHDDWLDDPNNFDTWLPRFEAIWDQIASAFADQHGQMLIFECFNEPHRMTVQQVNQVMKTCVNKIRNYSEHATRIIQINGISWDSPAWVLSNPNFYTGPKDDYMMLHIHAYDPYGYTWVVKDRPDHYWGYQSDYAALQDWTNNIQAWAHENNLPINYGEFGCTHDQDASTGRIRWYQAHADRIRALGWAAQVWDDNAGFKVYDRATGTWDDEVVAALTRHSPSPPSPSPPPRSQCPGNQGQCNCDWTKKWQCNKNDDGTECACRCCCGKPNAFQKCKWHDLKVNDAVVV